MVGNFNISFLVWKSITENTYMLVGRNDFRVNNEGDAGMQTHSFVPKSNERIKVLPGYVIGLYSIADVHTGIQAVTLPSDAGRGGSNNITYYFTPPSLDSITNISKGSLNMVPNVRPLISAEVGEVDDTPAKGLYSISCLLLSCFLLLFQSIWRAYLSALPVSAALIK